MNLGLDPIGSVFSNELDLDPDSTKYLDPDQFSVNIDRGKTVKPRYVLFNKEPTIFLNRYKFVKITD